MNNLYLIGGTERSGKTVILHRILKTSPMIAIQTDAIRDSVERALFDDMEMIAPIGNISFSGDVIFQRLIDNYKREREDITKHFSKKVQEGELVWDAIVGIISHYDNPSRLVPKGSTEKGIDLVIEGIEITPERVKSLNLKNFSIKPVFVGYTKDTNFDITITQFKKEGFKVDDIEYTKKKHDEHVEKGEKIESNANKYGYKFFSFDNNNFEEHCKNVLDYLLK